MPAGNKEGTLWPHRLGALLMARAMFRRRDAFYVMSF